MCDHTVVFAHHNCYCKYMDIGKVASGIILFFIGLVEVLLGFRFIFMLLAASSTAQFSNWVYGATDPLVFPFQGVFPTFTVASFSLELATVLGMIVYGVTGFILLQLTKYFEGAVVKPKMPSSAVTPSAPQPTYVQPQAPTIIQPQAPVVQLQPQQPIVSQPMAVQQPQTQAYTPFAAPVQNPPLAQNQPTSFNDTLAQMPPVAEQPQAETPTNY